MRLRLFSPLIIILSSIAPAVAENELTRELTTLDDSAPSGAPTEEKLRGCRGMKFMQKDKLEYPFPPKVVGKEYEASLGDQSNSVVPYHVKNEDGARAATCNGGFAAGYPCQNVDLLSMLDVDELAAALTGFPRANDIWGWTDPSSKREFSIVGLNLGTAFVEITDPYNPNYLGALPTETFTSNWRDVKVIDHYALIVSEAAGHGMQVFDLERLLTAPVGNNVWREDAHYDGFGNCHNIFVNGDSGFAYAVGSDTCSGGLHMINVNDPMNPVSAGCFSQDGYVHDVQCVIYNGPDTVYTGKEICFCSNEDTVTIVDVTNKSVPKQLSRRTYQGDRYTHQGWLTEDHAYFIFNDELDELYGITSKTRTHVLDVKDLDAVVYVGYHDGRTPAIDHNLYVKGDYVYQANYRAGFNVLKINNTAKATFYEAGYFDIYPTSDANAFNAAWSNYPYHESGVVTVSGMEQGLFVLKFKPATTPSPTTTPTSSPTDPPIATCVDPTLKFKFKKPDGDFNSSFKDCSWVGSNKEKRCGVKVNRITCPKTCNKCHVCKDSPLKFKIEKKNKTLIRDCKWVKESKAKRCGSADVANACRETCEVC